MTGTCAVWGEATRAVGTADEAEELRNDLSRGIVVGFGPHDGPVELEVAVNTDEGRASICWLSDGKYAVEAGIPRHPRAVPAWAYRDGDSLTQRHIPVDQTRVTPGRHGTRVPGDRPSSRTSVAARAARAAGRVNTSRVPGPDVVWVFTAAGDPVWMPSGSTVQDFASGAGVPATAARINGHPVPLTERLANGDVIDLVR